MVGRYRNDGIMRDESEGRNGVSYLFVSLSLSLSLEWRLLRSSDGVVGER